MLTNNTFAIGSLRTLEELEQASARSLERDIQGSIAYHRKSHTARGRQAATVRRVLMALDGIPEEIPVSYAGEYRLEISLGRFTGRKSDRTRLSRLLVAIRGAIGAPLKHGGNDLTNDGKRLLVELRPEECEQAVVISYEVPLPRKGRDGSRPKCRVVRRVVRELVCER